MSRSIPAASSAARRSAGVVNVRRGRRRPAGTSGIGATEASSAVATAATVRAIPSATTPTPDAVRSSAIVAHGADRGPSGKHHMCGRAVLLVSCPDRPGIVAAVTTFVAEHGGNIVDLQTAHRRSAGVYFQRVEVELEGFDLERDADRPGVRADRRALRDAMGPALRRRTTAGGAARVEGTALPVRPARAVASGRARHRRARGGQQPPGPRRGGRLVRRRVPPPADRR